MTQEEFSKIVSTSNDLTENQVEELSQVINTYPYFQSVRALLLKGLKNQESFKYNSELKTTAAYTTDRSILFDFITSDTFNQNAISRKIKANFEQLRAIEVLDIDDISVDKSVSIAYALNQQIKDTEGVLDPNLFQKKENNTETQFDDSENKISENLIAVDSENIEETPEEKLQLGRPLEFDKTETHSFTEWLKITNFKPIDRTKDEPVKPIKKPAPIENKLGLIDKFISENPKIKPVKDNVSKPPSNPIKHNAQDGLMTETLARIYLEQKNYEKAIQSYKILSLKYPEKSGFFADQIKAVEELQDINKKEK